MCFGRKSLNIKTAYSVTSGTGAAETDPVTVVAEKSVMQETEETALGTVKVDPEAMETGLK